MKILFLRGWQSVPGGVKPTYLAQHGNDVLNPDIDHDDFGAALRTVQSEFDLHQPDVIVGSSRGGALAMDIEPGDAPLVLLCPAWKKYGTVRTVKPGTTILHSRSDNIVMFADSEELVRISGLPQSALIEVGNDHRLADPESLKTLLDACHRSAQRSHGVGRPAEMTYALILPGGQRITLVGDRLRIGRLPRDTTPDSQIGDATGQMARIEGDCLHIPSQFISRTHAILIRSKDGTHAIEDANSRSGTYVNGQLIRERTVLRAGDTIRIGPLCLEYCAEDSSDAQTGWCKPAPGHRRDHMKGR